MSSELDIKQLLNLWFYVMRALKYFVVFIFLTITIGVFIGEKPKYHVIDGKIFGTYYIVKIRTNNKDKLLNKIISNELANINAKMSVFDSSSEISMINQSNNAQWIKLSKDMQHVLKNAHRIYQLSDGAFDPTAGKLIDLWGFGITEKTNNQPSHKEISDILKITGFDKFSFNDDYSQLKKLNNI